MGEMEQGSKKKSRRGENGGNGCRRGETMRMKLGEVAKVKRRLDHNETKMNG